MGRTGESSGVTNSSGGLDIIGSPPYKPNKMKITSVWETIQT